MKPGVSRVYHATGRAMLLGACTLLPSANVLLHFRRRHSVACKALVSGLDDAVQTLSRFEARELSGRFRSSSGWPPMKHIASLEKLQLSEALKMVKTNADFERMLEDVFVPGKLDMKAVNSGTTGLSVITATDGTRCILVVLNVGLPRVDTVNSLLPEGAVVAVKEPLLASTLLGSVPVIVAACHASLEFFELDGEGHIEEEAEALREQGDKLFSEGQYILAAQKYSTILSRLSVQGDEYVLAASNRAACFIQLKRFESALVDCDKALGVNPEHGKSLERKAAALGGLGEYKEALKCLERAEKNRETEALKARFTTLVQQMVQQSYNLDDYYTSGCKVTQAPECSDFLGPVEARMTNDGRGRGLFLTKDVIPGQLLLVSNAIVYVPNHDGCLSPAELQTSVQIEALRVASSSTRAFKQLQALADSSRAPDIALFKNGTIKYGNFIPLDIRLLQLLRRLSFGLVKSEVAPLYGGAWALPALINHSCLPNVSIDNVGPTLFMRASRSLKAGQELLLSYVESLEPWCIRSNANSWQFSCKCQRCILEKRHDRVLREILEPDPKQKPTEDNEEWLERMAHTCVKLEAALEKLRLSETEENWIRASASHEYVNTLLEMKSLKSIVAGCSKFPSALQMMKIIHETAPGQFLTSRMVAQLLSIDVNEETAPVCLEELSSRYGWELYLKPNILASLVSWLRTSESLDTVVRVK